MRECGGKLGQPPAVPPGRLTGEEGRHATQGRIAASLLVGGILLTLPTTAVARCSGSGPTFRCAPIVSESLRRRKSQGLPPQICACNETEIGTNMRGNTYVTRHVVRSRHRYWYKSPGGRQYKEIIKSLPGGSYQHKGWWK